MGIVQWTEKKEYFISDTNPDMPNVTEALTLEPMTFFCKP